MAERRSLLDDAGFDNIGKKKSGPAKRSGGGGTSADQKKLIAAVVLFVLAGGLIAWQTGLLDPLLAKKSQGVQFTPAEQKAAEEYAKEQELLELRPDVTKGGA